MHGFINVNKPKGMTSFDVIRHLKKIFPRIKMGHTGTLDPMAEGVLPVALGNATRVLEYIEDENKVYLAEMTLGGTSDTQDALGNVIWNSIPHFNRDRFMEVLEQFIGIIQQIPPMYSAVHHNGQRLYELARKGVEVERQPREIHIYSIDFIEDKQDAKGYPVVGIQVSCSKGTYIRTLCHDIGEVLGCGAFLSKLTRIQAGCFSIDSAMDLEKISDAKENDEMILLRMDYPLENLNKVVLSDHKDLERIFHGNFVLLEDKMPSGNCRVYNNEDKLLCIGRINNENNKSVLHPLKVFK